MGGKNFLSEAGGCVTPQGVFIACAAGIAVLVRKRAVVLRAIPHPFAKCAKGWATRVLIVSANTFECLFQTLTLAEDSKDEYFFHCFTNLECNRDLIFVAHHS